MSSREHTKMLKHNILLLIETQEQLNLLAEVTGMVDDAVHIDEPYLAFMDEVLWVIPQNKLEEGHFMSQVKPRHFMSWYRSIQRKLK